MNRKAIAVWAILIAASTGTFAQSSIRERPHESFGSTRPFISEAGACSGGGRIAFVDFNGVTKPVKVGVCTWTRDQTVDPNGARYEQHVDYYSSGPGKPLHQLLGCNVPGSVEFHIVYFDLDDGYTPGQTLFSNAASALVLERLPSGYAMLYNANFTKAVNVDYTLGNANLNGTAAAQQRSLSVRTASNPRFVRPYHPPDQARCD